MRNDDEDGAWLLNGGGVTVCALKRRRENISAMWDGDGIKVRGDGMKWRLVERRKEGERVVDDVVDGGRLATTGA